MLKISKKYVIDTSKLWQLFLLFFIVFHEWSEDGTLLIFKRLASCFRELRVHKILIFVLNQLVFLSRALHTGRCILLAILEKQFLHQAAGPVLDVVLMFSAFSTISFCVILDLSVRPFPSDFTTEEAITQISRLEM